MQTVQHDAKLWSRLLWVTSGLFNFLNSSYFLAIWIFSAKGDPSITLDLPPNTADSLMHRDCQQSSKESVQQMVLKCWGPEKRQHSKNIQKKNTYTRNWASSSKQSVPALLKYMKYGSATSPS
eukprot:6200579-Ditylum_brightwellii.AAC.1